MKLKLTESVKPASYYHDTVKSKIIPYLRKYGIILAPLAKSENEYRTEYNGYYKSDNGQAPITFTLNTSGQNASKFNKPLVDFSIDSNDKNIAKGTIDIRDLEPLGKELDTLDLDRLIKKPEYDGDKAISPDTKDYMGRDLESRLDIVKKYNIIPKTAEEWDKELMKFQDEYIIAKNAVIEAKDEEEAERLKKIAYSLGDKYREYLTVYPSRELDMARGYGFPKWYKSPLGY